MAYNDNRIYHSKNPIKAILIALAVILAAVIISSVVIFFTFQKYITYTSDGVRLDVPWLTEESVESSGSTDSIENTNS